MTTDKKVETPEFQRNSREELVEFTKSSSDNYTKSAFDFAYSSKFFSEGLSPVDFQYEGSLRDSAKVSGKNIGNFFREYGFELGSTFYEENCKDLIKSQRYEGNKFAAFYAGEKGYIKIERRFKTETKEDWIYFDITIEKEYNQETDFINKFVDKYCVLDKNELSEKDEDGEDEINQGSIYALVSTPSGYSLTEFTDISSKFQPDNYSEEIGEGFRLLTENFVRKTPDGRLTILTGDPGTGKTYFIRGLVEAMPKGKFIVIDPGIMANVSRPDMIKLFQDISNKKNPTILIIEDADSIIVQRMADNMNYITHLLNLTDGLFGQGLNIHIIASTNQSHLEIDSALRRPGRLHQILNFKLLSYEDAKRIYKRETGNEPEISTFKSLEVTPTRKKTTGFATKSVVETSNEVCFSIAEVYSHIRKETPDEGFKEDEEKNEVRTLEFLMFQ